MQLPTLNMTREDAELEVRRYRRARDTFVLSREEQQMLRAYRAIAKGTKVIDLHNAIALAGTRTQRVSVRRYRAGKMWEVEVPVDLPVLAAFRADKRWAFTDGIGRDGTLTLRDTLAGRSSPVGELRFQAVGVFARDDRRKVLSGWGDPAFRALLPPVPSYLRPTRMLHGERVPVALANYVMLWEAEWQLDRTVPPGDPALLKHLGGTLYTVEATWDLTPVEQAILEGRKPTRQELGQ
jgi:hypothetical protein